MMESEGVRWMRGERERLIAAGWGLFLGLTVAVGAAICGPAVWRTTTLLEEFYAEAAASSQTPGQRGRMVVPRCARGRIVVPCGDSPDIVVRSREVGVAVGETRATLRWGTLAVAIVIGLAGAIARSNAVRVDLGEA